MVMKKSKIVICDFCGKEMDCREAVIVSRYRIPNRRDKVEDLTEELKAFVRGARIYDICDDRLRKMLKAVGIDMEKGM